MQLHANTALIAIDVQRGFDDDVWGTRNNPDMEANGRLLLGAWRASGRPVVHTRHDSTRSTSPLAPGKAGNGFKPGFEPRSDSPWTVEALTSASSSTSSIRSCRSTSRRWHRFRRSRCSPIA